MKALILFIVLILPLFGNEKIPKLVEEGRFQEAAKLYQKQSNKALEEKQPSASIKARINAATCFKLSGDLTLALQEISAAKKLVTPSTPKTLALHLQIQEGSILSLGKRQDKAIELLKSAIQDAKDAELYDYLPKIHNDIAIIYAANNKYLNAFQWFTSAKALSKKYANDKDFLTYAQQNRLLSSYQHWKLQEDNLLHISELDGFHSPEHLNNHKQAIQLYEQTLRQSIQELNGTTKSTSNLFHMITAGMTAVHFGHAQTGFDLLFTALQAARENQLPKLEKAALISLSRLYLDSNKVEEAYSLINEAKLIQNAKDSVQDADLAVLSATILSHISPNTEETLSTIQLAVSSVEAIRSDLARTQNISGLGQDFRERAGLPYLLLADFHLRSLNADQASLKKARQAIETFKAWELEDFYRDDCVNLSLKDQRNLDSTDQLSTKTGSLYIIPLKDRTEILLGNQGTIYRWRSILTEDDLREKTRLLRKQLESGYGTPAYHETATFLYQHLISPGAQTLSKLNLEHLVIIPDGPLGNVPFAALTNPKNNQPLIKEYSISISPSLSVTSGKHSANTEPLALLVGCDTFKAPYTPLPGITRELNTLQKLYPNSLLLHNQGFTPSDLKAHLLEKPATIVHIGTHGEFGSSSADTYLLSNENEKISLDDLETFIRPKKYRGEPINILCLSACRTATGNDRAALGFAGTAVKSGARSVLATLWKVNDFASTEIVTSFHKHLLNGQPKARALRQAQLQYLDTHPNAHPYFWAPFILIGEWN